jgi:hypothetical protein
MLLSRSRLEFELLLAMASGSELLLVLAKVLGSGSLLVSDWELDSGALAIRARSSCLVSRLLLRQRRFEELARRFFPGPQAERQYKAEC